jgi:hypothetical protein
MLTAYAKGGFGVYNADGARNNYQDISVGADARLDIQRDWNVYGGASWNRRHDEFGTPNTPAGIGLPVTVYNQSTANVGYFQTFNRLNVRLDGHADYTVADYTALSAGTSNQYDQYFTFRAGGNTCLRQTSTSDRPTSSFTAPRSSSMPITIRMSSCCGWVHGCRPDDPT